MRVRNLHELLDKLISEDESISDKYVNALVYNPSQEEYNELYISDCVCDGDMNVQLICA